MNQKLCILYAIAFASMLFMGTAFCADEMQKKRLPEYNEAKLKTNFDNWLDSLDYIPVAADYARPIRELFTADRNRQLTSIKILGSTADIRVIPWLVPFLDIEDAEIRIWAGSSLEKIVSDVVHQDQARQKENREKLQPLAWLVLKLFRKSDDGNTHAYAAQITAMLGFVQFEEELIQCTHSRHPAVSRSAEYALRMLGLYSEHPDDILLEDK